MGRWGELVTGRPPMGGPLVRLLASVRRRHNSVTIASRLRAAKRFLRSPSVIIGEIVAIALAGVVGATFPQAGMASSTELARLREGGPAVATLVDLFALDHVFRSAWFVALTLLASASLSIVVTEQVRRLRMMWPQRLTEAHFLRAPFRAEFGRPARLAGAQAQGEPWVEVRTEGRLGLAGSPVFHLGLLFVIVAGGLRALFATEAVVDLIEGETLAPAAEAWAAQWPGVLAKPFRLDSPVTLGAVRATRYKAGDLRDLRVRLLLQRTEGVKDEEIAINRELQAPGGRLFLGSDFGPSALIEWRNDGAPPDRKAVLLTSQGKGVYEGSSTGPGGVRAHLRARVDGAGNQPTRLEVHVMGGSALLFTGQVRVSEEVTLASGQVFALRGVPFWARLRGSRDPALRLAYLGFTLVIAGATLIFTIVKVDTCVVVTPAGASERVFVALRAQRFAPLFAERFQQLVREQGGTA